MGDDAAAQELPSPQVELDVSLESMEGNDDEFESEFRKKQDDDSKFFS